MSDTEASSESNPESSPEANPVESVDESVGGGEPAWTADHALAEWQRINSELDDAKSTYEAEIAPATEAYQAKTAPLEEQRQDLAAWFVTHAGSVGADEFASDAGKVTISTRESPKIDNADSFFAWVAETNNAALLQKRISVTQFREFQKANPESVPPGVVVEVDRSAKFKPA